MFELRICYHVKLYYKSYSNIRVYSNNCIKILYLFKINLETAASTEFTIVYYINFDTFISIKNLIRA